eukprot:SAG11_NODE_3471_length_2429_cov_2.745494_2_plen_87_part_00
MKNAQIGASIKELSQQISQASILPAIANVLQPTRSTLQMGERGCHTDLVRLVLSCKQVVEEINDKLEELRYERAEFVGDDPADSAE